MKRLTIFEEANKKIVGSIEDMDKDIELKDNTINFSIDELRNSQGGTIKQMEKTSTEILGKTEKIHRGLLYLFENTNNLTTKTTAVLTKNSVNNFFLF